MPKTSSLTSPLKIPLSSAATAGVRGHGWPVISWLSHGHSEDRITTYFYDWRKRQIETHTKASSSVALVTRQTLDNKSRSLMTESLSLDHTTGQSTRFALTEALYDNRDRTYRSIRHGVDQKTGALTGETITQNSYFNAVGDLIKQVSNDGENPIEFEFDRLGRQISQTNALGHRTETAYNEVGNVISVTNPLGQTTTTRYDSLGRTIQTINAMNEPSGVPEFGIDGGISAQIDALGNRTEFQTDDAGRQTVVIDAEGNSSTTVYDSAGRVSKSIDALGNQTLFEYDFLGRQTKITDPMLDATVQLYDSVDNVILSIDAKGQQTTIRYDALGNRIQTTDRLGHQTAYEFDRAGRQSAITDSEGRTTRYGFDSFGRQWTTEYPDHVAGTAYGDVDYGIVHQEYDSQSRLQRRIDQKGNSITYKYDVIGRLVSRDYRQFGSDAISDSDTFTYDANGQPLTVTSGRYSNTVAFVYDAAGRQVEESVLLGTSGTSYVIQKSYDAAGRLTQLTYPDGSVVEHDYDSRNLLSEVSFNGDVVDTRSYDGRGQLEQSIYGNGVVTAFQYQSDSLVSQIATTNSGMPQVGTYDYRYDGNKNKLSESISSAGVMSDFGFGQPPTMYDAENRLTQWNRTDGNQYQAWNLSPVGNWKQFQQNSSMTDYHHNAAHELTSVDDATLEYDANGNRLGGVGGQVYRWDADNRLVGSGDHAFEYDALGRRVILSKAQSTEVLVNLGQQLIATYVLGAAANSPNRTFVYGRYIDEPLMMVSESQKYFFSRNQQYSITALTNSAGAVVERYAYDAYGNTLVLSPTGTPREVSEFANPFSYTGRFNHAEIGLMYFRARYYDPATGEFISRDPLEYVDGMSLYRGYFVPGDMDPSGKNPLGIAAAVFSIGVSLNRLAEGDKITEQVSVGGPGAVYGDISGRAEVATASVRGTPGVRDAVSSTACPAGSARHSIWITRGQALGLIERFKFKVNADLSWGGGKASISNVDTVGSYSSTGRVGVKITSVTSTLEGKDFNCECVVRVPCVTLKVHFTEYVNQVWPIWDSFRDLAFEFSVCGDGSNDAKHVD